MLQVENPQAIIEFIEYQKLVLDAKPFAEMELELKNLSADCIKALAKHYEPKWDWDETIAEPTKICPYFHFSKRINERYFVTFRTTSFSSSITFK